MRIVLYKIGYNRSLSTLPKFFYNNPKQVYFLKYDRTVLEAKYQCTCGKYAYTALEVQYKCTCEKYNRTAL